MEGHNFCDLGDVLRKLSDNGWNRVMIGGHAINCWAEHFRKLYPDFGWEEFFPLVSEDLDFLGSTNQLLDLERIFPGRMEVNWSNKVKATPVLGTFFTKSQGKKLQIDVLHDVTGVSVATAQKMALKVMSATTPPVEVHLLHPVQCVESKLWSLHSIDQQNRQDKKHLQIATKNLYCYLLQKICNSRIVIKAAQFVFDMACTEHGLTAYFKHGISIIDGIPIKEISQSSDEKLERFTNLNLGRLQDRLAESRKQYESTLRRLNTPEP